MTLAGVPSRVVLEAEAALAGDGAGTSFVTAERIGGGCINPAARIETADGRSYFLKWNESLPEMFEAEADGLEALRETESVRVPRVHGVGSGWLLLEHLEPSPPGPGFGRRLGEAVAELHAPREGAFGWHRANFIGPLPQENPWSPQWPRFWRDRRLLPQLRRARDAARIAGRDARRCDELLLEVEPLLAHRSEGPSLLHGDLWSGNVLAAEGRDPALVDPAVYLGDREVDLAMADLFGGWPEGFREAYGSARPLAPGYEEARRDLYQLYPLLVHVNLFGGGYVAQTMRRVERLLSL